MKILINGYKINITVEGSNGKASREELCYFLNMLWCAIDGAKYCDCGIAYQTGESTIFFTENVKNDIIREIERIDPRFYEGPKE